jgi:hypothetical protein
VILAGAGRDRWYLQIGPTSAPGLIGRLFGRTDSASDLDIHTLALDVHAILVATGCDDIRWENGPPDANSPREPPPPPAAKLPTARVR